MCLRPYRTCRSTATWSCTLPSVTVCGLQVKDRELSTKHVMKHVMCIISKVCITKCDLYELDSCTGFRGCTAVQALRMCEAGSHLLDCDGIFDERLLGNELEVVLENGRPAERPKRQIRCHWPGNNP